MHASQAASDPCPCSGRTLVGEAAPARLLCLTGCAIPAPVVMTLGAPVQLDCQVSAATGEVQLRSTSKLSKAAQTHFRATMGSVPREALELADGADSDAQPPSSSAADGGAGADESSKQAAVVEEAEEAGAMAPCTPPPLQRTRARRLARLLGVSPAADAAPRRGVRCTAEVTLELQGRGSGWVAHPAVTDNALQLGPATGDVGKEDDADVTRVVAGMAAYVAAEQASSGDWKLMCSVWLHDGMGVQLSPAGLLSCSTSLLPPTHRCHSAARRGPARSAPPWLPTAPFTPRTGCTLRAAPAAYTSVTSSPR